MLKKVGSAVCIIIIIVCASMVLAKQNNASFGYEVIPESSGSARLKIISETSTDGLWLGITLYPPNVKNAAGEGQSQVILLAKGKNTTNITVDPRFINGTFEAAIWGKKLSKQDCAATDTVCQNLGYKLINMQAYIWAYINGAK